MLVWSDVTVDVDADVLMCWRDVAAFFKIDMPQVMEILPHRMEAYMVMQGAVVFNQYPSALLYRPWVNHSITPWPLKAPWQIWVNT